MQAEYNYKPDEITYMPLPCGKADVWLRKNIEEVEEKAEETESGDIIASTKWIADEIYFRTELSEDEIADNFDTIFDNGGVVIDEETEKEVADGITIADRVDALESAVAEVAEALAEVMG